MRIVVTGGAGDLGHASSARSRLGARRGPGEPADGVDLTTGEGLEAALRGADAVVHCADDPSRGDTVTVYGTRRLADAAAASAVHLVHISIVGIDEHPMTYYRRKLRAEQGIDAAGGPATVLRATQFHSLAAFFARRLTSVGRFTVSIGDMAFQPVDTDFVARRLVDFAVGPRPPACVRAPGRRRPRRAARSARWRRLVRAHRGASAPHVVRVPPLGRLHACRLREPQRPGPRRGGPGRPDVRGLARRAATRLTGADGALRDPSARPTAGVPTNGTPAVGPLRTGQRAALPST